MNTFANQYTLSEEQLRNRLELANSLLEHPWVQEFMDAYTCPFEVLETNAYRFKNWLAAKEKASQVTVSDLDQDPRAGGYFDLRYDADLKILEEVYTEVPLVAQHQEDIEYLKYYQLFDLSKNMQNAHFEKLNLDDVTTSYITIAQKLSSFYRSDETGYYIYGNLGVGKSYLAACVSNYFAKHQKRVVFVHVPSLLNHMKQLFNAPADMERHLRILRTVPLLVLDDLGAEPITSWSRDEVLLSILNDRLENKRKTIITSNATPEMLHKLYAIDNRGHSDEIRSARFVDRVLALTKPYEITGKNRRVRK